MNLLIFFAACVSFVIARVINIEEPQMQTKLSDRSSADLMEAVYNNLEKNDDKRDFLLTMILLTKHYHNKTANTNYDFGTLKQDEVQQEINTSHVFQRKEWDPSVLENEYEHPSTGQMMAFKAYKAIQERRNTIDEDVEHGSGVEVEGDLLTEEGSGLEISYHKWTEESEVLTS